MSDRPKIGPADPETRRKLLHAALDQPTAATGVAARPVVKVKKKNKTTLAGLLDPNQPREATHNGKTMMEVVDAAVKNTPED